MNIYVQNERNLDTYELKEAKSLDQLFNEYEEAYIQRVVQMYSTERNKEVALVKRHILLTGLTIDKLDNHNLFQAEKLQIATHLKAVDFYVTKFDLYASHQHQIHLKEIIESDPDAEQPTLSSFLINN